MTMSEDIRIFLLEAYEKLDQIEQDLLELEKDSQNADLLNSVFRSIHTIKGNSGFLAFGKLEGLCHQGETLLDRMRNGQMKFSAEIATVLLNLVDAIRVTLTHIESDGSEGQQDYTNVVSYISQFLNA